MTLPLQNRSYTTDLYSYALSAIYQFYDRTRDPGYALSQDVDIYEIMLRDPKVHQGVQDRLTSVCGPDCKVAPFNNSKDPNDIALAKLVDDAFRFIPHFADSRMRLATAIFRGQSCELMTGKKRYLRLGGIEQAENWWMFNEFKNIDPRRFTIRNVHNKRKDGSTKVDTELWMSTVPMSTGPSNIPESDWIPGKGLMSYGFRKVDHPDWMIRVIYNNDEARLGYGRGLVDCLYFYHWLKQILLREGLQGVERWSQGIVVGTLDTERAGAPDTQTMQRERQAMVDALTAMRSRHVYVQGKHDDIEVITGGGEGHQMVMGLIEYVDDCIMAVCTGAVLMSSKSDAGEAGSHARDKVGQDTQNKIVLSDQKKIDEDISTYAIGLWVRTNWKLLCKYGLQNARMPQLKTVQPEDNNPNEFATRISTVWQSNPKFKVRKDEAYEKLGLTPVNEEEDEWLEGADPAAVAGSAGNPTNDPSMMMQEGNKGSAPPADPQVGGAGSQISPKPVAAMDDRRGQDHTREVTDVSTGKPMTINGKQDPTAEDGSQLGRLPLRTPHQDDEAKIAAILRITVQDLRKFYTWQKDNPGKGYHDYAEAKAQEGLALATSMMRAREASAPAPITMNVSPPAAPITMNVALASNEKHHEELMAAQERGSQVMMTVADKLEAIANRPIPAPIVNVPPSVVNVPAPIVNMKAAQVHNVVNVPKPAPPQVFIRPTPPAIVNFDASKSNAGMEKLIKLGERALDWFMSRKPAKRNIEFTFDDKGNLKSGVSVEEKK